MGVTILISCNKGDDDVTITPEGPNLTGNNTSYSLSSVSDEAISGTVNFAEMTEGGTMITIQLTGTSGNEEHPAHIHVNSAVESGGIALSLEPVDPATGKSVTEASSLDDGTNISYNQLLDFDGYVNVHQSGADLATLIAQGDIGGNELTGDSKVYVLNEKEVEGIDGTITFQKRKNGFSLATLDLNGTPEGGQHPAHIHQNSALEGGGIMVSFNPVDGATGMSMTTIRKVDGDDGDALPYDEILNFDGYVNVHLSGEELSTIVAQGDIGGNELTEESMSYNLIDKDVEGIEGTVTFQKRKNGFSLATIALSGTPDGGMHPAHIHENSAIEGGGIVVSFNPVDGTTGMSYTTIRNLDGENEVPLPYDELLNYDGYVNVHLSAEELSTLVAQGDIGSNELTGEMMVYDLAGLDTEGISGTATFAERKGGATLITLQLEGTNNGEEHPAHIHRNSVAEGGGIAISLNAVDGGSGMSMTNVRAFDGTDMTMNSGDPVGFEALLDYNGYINVHKSAAELATIIAQGNIGSNVE